MNAISYSVIHNDIHVFVFATSQVEAVDAYLRVWYDEMPNFWRNSPHFDRVVRVLLDLRRSGPLPLPLLYTRLRQYMIDFPDRPHAYFAYLMYPYPGFISQVQTMATMIGERDMSHRRFFNADERDNAIVWLKACPPQQTDK
jgi:hypothetical protein